MDFKKHLPSKEDLRNTRTLSFLRHIVLEPNLWHFNRHSVSYATLIGLFCCFLPVPFQMIPCVLLVAWIRCNLPLAIALVWISNPITFPPILYFSYQVGTLILGEPNLAQNVDISLDWALSQVSAIWQPLVLGSLVSGTALGVTGFVVVRIYWRWKVARDWSHRKRRQLVSP